MGTAGTLQVVKRLFDVAEAHDWVLSAEWCPRGLMSIEDSLSRVAADSADRCSLPTLFREALCAHVWNAAPYLDLFADAGNRVADKYCSRYPDLCSDGEGLSYDLSAAPRIWCFPPFSLVRPLLVKIVACARPPDMIVVLPDTPLVRFALRAWTFLDGPTTVVTPPLYDRSTPPSKGLVVCVSPACRPRQLAAAASWIISRAATPARVVPRPQHAAAPSSNNRTPPKPAAPGPPQTARR